MIPYGRHSIDPADIEAVIEVLRSDWLTTGPKIAEFEQALADYTDSKQAVAVSSGTAGLHCAAHAIGLAPGDEVIVPALTFAATATCVIAMGAKPVIVDVEPETLLIDANGLERLITPHTKAIIGVDYAGHPCDYKALRAIADRHGLYLISDSCHALGAEYHGRAIARMADLTVFSFHPVKHITTGEGGMIVTDDDAMAERMRRFRNHGIDADLHQRFNAGTWRYEITDLGFNYRITDFQCALGLSQLTRLEAMILRRREIARRYDQAFETITAIQPLTVRDKVCHAYHLYVVRVEQASRARLFAALRELGIGVNVHYRPLNLHPFYQQQFGAYAGQCPIAEAAYDTILSLPVFAAMHDDQLAYVIHSILQLVAQG